MAKCAVCSLLKPKRKCQLVDITICSVCCKKISFDNSKCRACSYYSQPNKAEKSPSNEKDKSVFFSQTKEAEDKSGVLDVKQRYLTVTGAPKTASCSMVGMLNSHPEIFIFMQVEFQSCIISSGYAKSFLAKYPDARYIFRSSDNLDVKYSELIDYFQKKGRDYKYIGDKIVDVNQKRIDEFVNHKVIFTIRDIRTWLIKKSIRILYLTVLDVVAAAIDYTTYFIKSFSLPNVLYSRMEDFIGNNKRTIENVGNFLDMPLYPHIEKWWDKVIIIDENDPKHTMTWWENHPRSATEPVAQDTIVKLKPHPFWEELLPIFDKYYIQTERKFTIDEIQKDLEKLKNLKIYSPLPLNQLYSELQEDPNYSL